MQQPQISTEILIEKIADATASGTTDVNSVTVDLQGYEGALVFATVATGNAGNFIKLQHGDTTSPTADVEGSKVVADTNGDTVKIELVRPLKRYFRAVVVRGAATAVGEVYVIKFNSKWQRDRNTDLKALVSPVTGTP